MARGKNQEHRTTEAQRSQASHSTFMACYKTHLLVWLASMLCYANSLTGEFVFDDHEAIETNLDVRPTTPLWSIFSNDFWGEPVHSNTSHKSYRPITILTFRWNFAIGGLDPTGYHLVNIMLHGMVSSLFVSSCDVVFYGMTSSNSRTLLASLLFAVHPIHTEAVANVVGRADLLCALFFLLSFLSYSKCVSFRTLSKATPCGTLSKATPCGTLIRPVTHSRTWLFTSVVFCILSLLSKEQGLTVLAVCMVYDLLYISNIHVKDILLVLRNPVVVFKSFKVWPKWTRKLVERMLLLMLSCVILLYIRIVVIGDGVPRTFVESDNPTHFHPDPWTRFRTYTYICFLNAWLLLCPNILCYDWSMDSIARIESWFDYRNAASLCFVTFLGFVTWKALRFYTCCDTPTTIHEVEANGSAPTKDLNKNYVRENKIKNLKAIKHNPQRQLSSSNLLGRSILQAVAMVTIPFTPASNLFFPVGFVIAERILYIPSMGFCILAALGIHAMFEVEAKPPEQNSTKSTDEIHNKEEPKNSLLPSLCLSIKGRVAFYCLLGLLAVKAVNRNAEWKNSGTLAYAGIVHNPTNAKMHLCMGNYLAKKGYRSCEKHYREALRLRPHYTLAWVNLGLVLINTDRQEEAEKCYVKALSINPDSANANTNMANLLRITQRHPEAEYRYKKALTLRPDDPALYHNLGYVLEMLGKPKEATKNFLQSIALLPSNAKAYIAVARILLEPMNDDLADKDSMNALATAEEYLMIGLRHDKTDVEARLLFAKVLLKRGEVVHAKNELFYVLEHDKYNLEAEYMVGRAMEREGKLNDAKKLFRLILQQHPTHTKTREALQKLSIKINSR